MSTPGTPDITSVEDGILMPGAITPGLSPNSEANVPDVHPALTTFDILLHIFKHFDAGFDSDERRESRKHLYWAALTSREFLHPALMHLWRSMDQLHPLLHLLPTLEVLDNVYMITGDITDQHWAHMDSYGRHVRYFTAQRPIPVETCFQLSHLRKSPLLPNLRTLCYLGVDQALLSEAPLMLCPNLQKIVLEGEGPLVEHILRIFISTLASKMVPSLTRLEIRAPINAKFDFSCFRHLNYLELSSQPVELEPLIQIGALPTLGQLLINLSHTIHFPDDLSLDFKQMKYITVIGHMATITSFFTKLEADILRSINISIANASIQVLWEPFFAVIRKWMASLRGLHLYKFTRRIEDYYPNLHDFQLEGLTLGGWGSMSDAKLRQLAIMCPKIQRLSVKGNNRQKPDGTTLSILRDFAELCPKLLHLQIWIDDIATPFLDDSDFRSHRLKEILITSSKAIGAVPSFTDIARIAQYIDRLFPNVQVLHDSPLQPLKAEEWVRVGHLVHLCQSVRRDQATREGPARQ